jgi:hypothetical protein
LFLQIPQPKASSFEMFAAFFAPANRPKSAIEGSAKKVHVICLEKSRLFRWRKIAMSCKVKMKDRGPVSWAGK